MAFVHVVGLGLGVWQISPKQKPIFAGIFLDALVDLKPDHVSDLGLSWVFEPALVAGNWELPKEFDWGNKKAVDGRKVKLFKILYYYWLLSTSPHPEISIHTQFHPSNPSTYSLRCDIRLRRRYCKTNCRIMTTLPQAKYSN